MNKVILMGRLTRDPDVRYQGADQASCVAKYSIAVDRKFRRQGEQKEADFFNCTAFGRQAEFVEKYLHQGTKILMVGRIQNDNYTNRNGEKVYSVGIIVEEIEFAESKAAQQDAQGRPQDAQNGRSGQSGAHDRPLSVQNETGGEGWMQIPEGAEEDLPFA